MQVQECEATNGHKCAQRSNKPVICTQRFQYMFLFGTPITQSKEHISIPYCLSFSGFLVRKPGGGRAGKSTCVW